MKTITHSLTETEALAQAFVRTLDARDDAATVVGLYGDLGSGKTTFSKSVAAALGINEADVTSPTYVIMKIYEISGSVFSKFIHIDAYRLESDRELTQLGWHDMMSDPRNLILVEWPEKVIGVMPPDHVVARFTFVNETTREIDIEAMDAMVE